MTPTGFLTVSIDRHDGNGFVAYYTQSIVGVGGEPAVPANVYFGLSASTGGSYNIHQIGGLTVTALPTTTTPVATISESFASAATTPNLWAGFGDACLTAGTSATPTTSLPACGAAAPQDAAGQGALQLTTGTNSQVGMVVDTAPVSTANGLQITFTDYAFHGTSAGADGVAVFLADASKPVPTQAGQGGSGLAYGGSNSTNGVPNAYVGVGLDEFGNFSNVAGGPGQIPETIAVRGAAALTYPYIGGAKNAAGAAASLPFHFDQPSLVTRPAAPHRPSARR